MLFTMVCQEKDGPHQRIVHSVFKTADYIWWLYDRVKDIPNFITADPRSFSPESLLWLFLPYVKLYSIDNIGVVVLKRLRPARADVHITFWDKRLRGREELAKRIAQEIFNEEGLSILETCIPLESRAVLAFSKRVGFVSFSEPKDSIQRLLLIRPGVSTV